MITVPEDVSALTPIRVSLINAILAILRELVRGPKVASPLSIMDGTVYLADELKLYNAHTTSTIQPRAGKQLGKGFADLHIPNATGLLAPVAGNPSRTVYTDIGTQIPNDVWIKVYFSRGIWQVFNGDCSGVASGVS